ncbi:MAG: P-II family nitrogen regulator [Clostridiales bacterium]|jgi:nitrogen regulatory protein PII|nr:P-II family nitrogen regulator [Clostridiales bacterium]
MENNDNMRALFIIINAGFGDTAVEAARECGARGATIINARGTAANLKSFLGIHVEPEKEIVISLVDEETADKIMEAIPQKAGVTTPANGVCFCLPIDRMTMINKLSPEKDEEEETE